MNIGLLVGLLHPSQSAAATQVFWQWLNQTYNTGVNYANRNASAQQSTMDVAKSYAVTVSCCCGISFGGNKLIDRVGAQRVPAYARFLLPYVAVASAGLVNVGLMRSSDYLHGVSVNDAATREPIDGVSKIAGRTAIGQVMASRAFVPLPLIALPPFIVGWIMRRPFFAKRPGFELPVTLGVIGVDLLFAAPMGLALYPPECRLPVSTLEPEFHNLRNSNGEPITEVIFNKGL